MATDPRRFPSERRLDDLLATYRQAQRTVVAQIRAAIAEGDLDEARQRRYQLAAVIETLDHLGLETDRVAREIIEGAFMESARATARQAASITGISEVTEASFAGVSREAVEALQESMLGRLSGARETIGRQAADVFAKAQRRTTMLALLGAEGSPRSAAKHLRDSLIREGQVGFIDRAGKRWALDTYAEMATRTVTREAVVQGAIHRMAAHGIDLARVSTHASACQICIPWQGRLISLDGQTREHEGEAVYDAAFIPPFHPRCRHSLAPVAVRAERVERQLQEA